MVTDGAVVAAGAAVADGATVAVGTGTVVAVGCAGPPTPVRLPAKGIGTVD